MSTTAMPNVLRDQAVPNLLTGMPIPPIRVRSRLPRGVTAVALAGVVAVVVALLGGGS